MTIGAGSLIEWFSISLHSLPQKLAANYHHLTT